MRRFSQPDEGGYAMAALLVTLGVMSFVLGVAMPVWRTVVQREKEEELIFRGRQYARAIALYQRRYAASYPASLDVLVEQKFLRKKFKDPMAKNGLMCSARLDPTFVLKAFSGGADGVLITGCHPGECHYIEQNYKMLRRYLLLKRVLGGMGIEPERLKLVWASAAEGVRLANEITKLVEEIRALGPLNWPQWQTGNGHHAMEVSQPEEVTA